MFTIFKIFAGAWYEPINDCMETTTNPYVCPAVIIPFFVIGYLVIWNVFTAVLLDAFDATALQFAKPWQVRNIMLIEYCKNADYLQISVFVLQFFIYVGKKII